MKRLLTLATVILTMFTACGQNKKEMKVLVSYFSATGTTKAVAQDLAKTMNADLYEIEPQELYTQADLDWTDSTSRSSLEMKDLSSRPKLKNPQPNVDDYDVVFVGFPIWWYTAPTIINSYLESANFEGKTVIAFATSGGSTIEKSVKDLKKAYPKCVWKNGKLLNSYTQSDLQAWKKELGL